MAVFDLLKSPSLSDGISAAEQRTKLSTQGALQMCGGAQALTLPFFIAPAALARLGGRATSRGGGGRQTQMEAVGLSKEQRGPFGPFLFLKGGGSGLMEHFLIFT